MSFLGPAGRPGSPWRGGLLAGACEPRIVAYTLIETAKLKGVGPQTWLASSLAPLPDRKIAASTTYCPAPGRHHQDGRRQRRSRWRSLTRPEAFASSTGNACTAGSRRITATPRVEVSFQRCFSIPPWQPGAIRALTASAPRSSSNQQPTSKGSETIRNG